MPGVFGPILTMGVALGTAAVVVANPVTAPHADIQIPANAMTTDTGDALDMLDANFIKAVGPGPDGSSNPLAVLKDLVSELVADATDLGRNAVLHAFVAGATVVSRPELTAASHPYIPEVPAGPDVLPWSTLTPPVVATLQPAVAQALTAVLANAGGAVDPAAIAAAFAAGAQMAAQQSPFLEGIRVAITNAVQPVIDRVVDGLPQPVIGDAIGGAEQQLQSLRDYIAGTVRGRDIVANPDGSILTEGAPVAGIGDAAAALRRRVAAAAPVPAAPAPVGAPPALSAVVPKAAGTTKVSHPVLASAIGKLKAAVAAARAQKAAAPSTSHPGIARAARG